MKLFQFGHREDFGHELYFIFLNYKNYSVFQVSVDWNDCPGFPYIQITSGMNRVLGVLFCVWKFGLCFDILGRTWNYEKNVSFDFSEE